MAGLTPQYEPYLKVFGNVDPASSGAFVYAFADVSDTLTVANGPAAGTFVFSYTLSGVASSTEGLGSGLNYLRVNNTSPVALSGNSALISYAGTFSVPYTNSSAEYDLLLSSMASCCGGGSCSSYFDFSDTLNIVGLQILDVRVTQ